MEKNPSLKIISLMLACMLLLLTGCSGIHISFGPDKTAAPTETPSNQDEKAEQKTEAPPTTTTAPTAETKPEPTAETKPEPTAETKPGDSSGSTALGGLSKTPIITPIIKLPPINLQQLNRRYVNAINIGISAKEQESRAEAATGGRQVLEPDLNVEAGGDYIYLGVEWSKPGEWKDSLTDLLVSKSYEGGWHKFDHHEESGDYAVVRRYTERGDTFTSKYCDVNYGTKGEYLYIYAAFTRGEKRAPIYDITVYNAGNKNTPKDKARAAVIEFAEKEGWEIVNYAFSEEPADLNLGAGGDYIYLLIKKDFKVLS